ncbi:MAG TPA: hypothetical protein VGK54_09155 [Chloroflexota bacterium]
MRRVILFLSVLAASGIIAAPGASSAAPAPPQPGDYIVDVENPDCPIGGPIVRITPSGEATVLAQGGLLKKPRGTAVQDQNTLIVADGQAGLLKLDLRTGTVTRIAFGPPWQPREVAIDSDGTYIVADWPDASADTLRAANGMTSTSSSGTRTGPQPTAAPGTVGRLGAQGEASAAAGPPAIYRVTPAGKVTLIASGAPLKKPHGMSLDAFGNILVTDGGFDGNGPVRVTPDGQMTLLRRYGPGFLQGAALRVDGEGNYIVAENTGAVLKLTPDGDLTTHYRGDPFSPHPFQNNPNILGGPRGLDIDSNGDYIVLDQTQGALYRLTPGGDISQIYQGSILCHPAGLMIFRPGAGGRPPAPAVVPPSAPAVAPDVVPDGGVPDDLGEMPPASDE